jgi:hypothetical protein
VKYGDVPALVALAAPTRLWLAGEGRDAEIVRDAYRAAGAEAQLKTGAASPADAIRWLLSE